MKKTYEILSEDVFLEKFTIVDSPSGESYWDLTEFEELKKHDVKNVWSVIEDEDGNLIASAGYHIVNRTYYLVTEEKWEDDMQEYYWFKNDELI